MKKVPNIKTIQRMMVSLFLLATLSVALAVGLIVWQQGHYSSLRIDSLAFHPQSITDIADAKEHLNRFKSWADKTVNAEGEILLSKRNILGSHPLAILALLKQHIVLLQDRQSTRNVEKYERVAVLAFRHVNALVALMTHNSSEKVIQKETADRLIRSLSLSFSQWRKIHELDFVQNETTYNEFKDKANFVFYIILGLLVIISIPLAILFVRRINNTLQHIELTQNQLSELNQTLETRVEQRTHELADIQETLVRNERLAALGQLTGTVSHELRNPLGTITTSLYTLRNKLQTQNINVDKVLDRIERNVKRCDDIVEDLLQYSRIQELHIELLDFELWFDEIVNDYKQLEDLSIDYDMESVGYIEFDPHRLRRVFINLFDNAIRVMSVNNKIKPASVIWVKVGAENLGVSISIRDSGAGVPKDIVTHIFEPLFSTHAFGVGLGLSIVRQIMEQHRGTVNLDANVLEGACFRCWLPNRQ